MKLKTILSKLRIPLLFVFVIFMLWDIENDITQKIPLVYLIPSILMFLGGFFNLLVIYLNGMKMPVRLLPKDNYKLKSSIHFYYKNPKQVKFELLTDRYGILFISPTGKLKLYKISLGDIIIFIGFLLIMPFQYYLFVLS